MSNDAPTVRPKDEQASIGEVVEFVKTYAKQETVGPLKGAGRWIAFGAAGAVCLGIGLSLLLLGAPASAADRGERHRGRPAVVAALRDRARRVRLADRAWR